MRSSGYTRKKSNNIHDLNSHIWDAWADADGSIGTCYGDVVGRKFIYKGEETDQMDYVLRQLKENPYSRRIMTNLYQFEYLHSGALDPCCYSMTYNVTKDAEDILQDEEIDAVLICSSTDTHSKYIIEAARAGKHIFCEKTDRL